MKYTNKAKQFLSDDIFKKVISYCKNTEFSQENAFRDILINGVNQNTPKVDLTNDSVNVLMGDNQELAGYVISKMTKTFNCIAVDYGYTEHE